MTTKWAFEVPVQNLKDFDEDQDFIFALSFLFDKREPLGWDYTRYIQEVSHTSLKTLWIDNSYNELGVADESRTMRDLYVNHKPQILICPDDPEWDSVKIGYEFQKLKSHIIPVSDLMVVIQDWEMFIQLSKGGAEHFAVPYDTRQANFTTSQLEGIPNLHFLGFNDPEEIRQVQPASCDTGMPIKLALEDKTLAKWMTEGCPHIHNRGYLEYFQMVMTDQQIKIAKENITNLKEVCKWN